jgi:RHS repeat-associated protein
MLADRDEPLGAVRRETVAVLFVDIVGFTRMAETILTDPRTNVTNWSYDVQGRLIGKQYADTSAVTYAYETTTGRLKSVTDALSQVKSYSYAKDDLLLGTTYSAAVHTTPNVSFTYDPYFRRPVRMIDGTGITSYVYVPVGSLGALQLQQEIRPLSIIVASNYDELGRLKSRTVSGAGAETFGYDSIGRLVTHVNDLGSFTSSYLGQTGQVVSRALASSTLATTWSYLANSGDRRLSGISNVGLSSGQFSTYGFTTTPENFISGITEASDTALVYPAALTQTATYNNLNQLSNLSGQALTFDAVGNLTSDGQRNYTWDAENRLIGITYPGVSGKSTAFTYDGLGRRTTIVSAPAGVTMSYLWCGSNICQAHNANTPTIRNYYAEGELVVVPGAPNQLYYYGVDQIGSVRRAFSSTSGAPAYSYDPYGSPLQITAPLTDFVYGGMFYNADSGLYLTQYRAYDPVAGRWLSRDPMGEMSDPEANLYAYVRGNPISLLDPFGLAEIPSMPPPGLEGGPWTPAEKIGKWLGPPQPKGPRAECQWVPEGGPSGSQGYWKTQKGASGEWSRFDQKLNPITEQQAHPGNPSLNPLAPNPLEPLIRYGNPVGAFVGTMLYSSPAY